MSKLIQFKKPDTLQEEISKSIDRANIDYGFTDKGSENAESITKEMVNLAETKRKLAEAKKFEAEAKGPWISVASMIVAGAFHVWWEGHGRILPRKVEEIERVITSKLFRK